MSAVISSGLAPPAALAGRGAAARNSMRWKRPRGCRYFSASFASRLAASSKPLQRGWTRCQPVVKVAVCCFAQSAAGLVPNHVHLALECHWSAAASEWRQSSYQWQRHCQATTCASNEHSKRQPHTAGTSGPAPPPAALARAAAQARGCPPTGPASLARAALAPPAAAPTARRRCDEQVAQCWRCVPRLRIARLQSATKVKWDTCSSSKHSTHRRALQRTSCQTAEF